MVPEISSTTDRIFCHFQPFFPLSRPNNPKNQNFEEMKKKPGEISFYTSAPKIMIICYMVRDRCNYFSFWAIFCPFTPLTACKIKILKKLKKKNT